MVGIGTINSSVMQQTRFNMQRYILFILILAISCKLICSEFNSTGDDSTDLDDIVVRVVINETDVYLETKHNKNVNFSGGVENLVSEKNLNITVEDKVTTDSGWYVLKPRSPDKKIRHHEKKLKEQKKKIDSLESHESGIKNNKKYKKHRHHHTSEGVSNLRGKKDNGKHSVTNGDTSFGNNTASSSPKYNTSVKRRHEENIYPKTVVRDAKTNKQCVGCDPKEKAKRINSFQRQLLKKLRLESIPVVTKPPPRLPPQYDPEFMQDDSTDDNDISFYAQTKQLIITATDVSRHCSPRHATGCYHFKVRGKITGYVSSAKLWVLKNRDQNDKQQSFTISELEQDRSYNYTKLRPKNIVDRIETDVKKGWLQFNMTKSVRKWIDKPHMNHGFSIRCKTCYYRKHRVLFGAKEGYKPLLVISLAQDRGRRGRRSLDCTPGETSCCRQQFYISFEEIENFVQVLQPKGIWANYCTGSCHEPTLANYNHTTLIQAMRWRSRGVNATFRETLKPCCAPISYATKSMLFIDANGDVSYSEVPNISVHACGCV